MRVGICGGTFDPLHKGHIAVVEAALASRLVDRVIVIPAGTPPHKQDRLVSAALYRFAMARAAFAANPAVTVSDVEILRKGPSYTLDTASFFRQKRPEDQFYLIYGSDILCDIEKWHQPLTLLASFSLLLADRGGIADSASRARAAQLMEQYGADIRFFALPAVELSATLIRQKVRQAEDITGLVPWPVADFIKKHALYHWQDELSQVDGRLWDSLHGLERELWTLLEEKRQLHSLNVLRYSLFLAARHGLDLEQAGLAAILHDCAKNLPLSEQYELAGQYGAAELALPNLVHGPAGARLAQLRFGIEDPAVLRAICCHSTGSADMTELDQIIFLADKIEPAREYADLAKIRLAALHDLDLASLLCLEEVQLHLAKKQLPPHPFSLAAQAEMVKRLQNRQI